VDSKKHILNWEIAGIVFVFLVGALLHFIFEWSGENRIVGVVASVNESVWEHFKQGFWPMSLWAAIEYRALRAHTGNLLLAKGIAVWVLPIITGLAFYAYTAVTGKEMLPVDIAIFAVATAIAQYISYRIMAAKAHLMRYANLLGLAAIIALGAILILTTYYPPHLPIFLDENTGIYGLP
jgi:hypothetical protein